MAIADEATNELIERASLGEEAACQQLLTHYHDRLRQMIALRLDRRVAARIDPSDVIQDVLMEAHQKLSDYLKRRPLPFYPWLRAIAWERLLKLHRHHLQTQKRTVRREEPQYLPLPDESALQLADRLVAVESSPSQQLVQAELRRRVQEALAQLSVRDHEVLVLRYLEQLSTREIAAVLDISEGAIKTRHVRALDRLHKLLDADVAEDER